VLGIQFIKQLGLIYYFQKCIVTWENLSIPIRQHGSIIPEELTIRNDQDDEASKIPLKALSHQIFTAVTIINPWLLSVYTSHLISKTPCWICLLNTHLCLIAQLKNVRNVQVHLELKPSLKPFCARAYKKTHHILNIDRKEVEELCCIGLLELNVYSAWGAHCLFRAKKNGGIPFLTDPWQLNKYPTRKPVHLPLINEGLWKIQGFICATCLDANTGYYHFELDEEVRKLCDITLLLGCMLGYPRDVCHHQIFSKVIWPRYSMILKTS
jgi:hypothetical protein